MRQRDRSRQFLSEASVEGDLGDVTVVGVQRYDSILLPFADIVTIVIFTRTVIVGGRLEILLPFHRIVDILSICTKSIGYPVSVLGSSVTGAFDLGQLALPFKTGLASFARRIYDGVESAATSLVCVRIVLAS